MHTRRARGPILLHRACVGLSWIPARCAEGCQTLVRARNPKKLCRVGQRQARAFGLGRCRGRGEYLLRFADNALDGEGTHSWLDGRSYTGQWKAQKMHGSGVFIYSDGRRYEGERPA